MSPRLIFSAPLMAECAALVSVMAWLAIMGKFALAARWLRLGPGRDNFPDVILGRFV
jgi:hypothetical protein